MVSLFISFLGILSCFSILVTSVAVDTSKSSEVPAPLSNIILYDGKCNFCNSWVDIISKYDKKHILKMIPIQTEKGKSIFKMLNKDPTDLSSIVYIRNLTFKSFQENKGQNQIETQVERDKETIEVYFKSTAITYILEEIMLPKVLGHSFLYLVPEFLRDSIYDLIAKHRYKFLGMKELIGGDDEMIDEVICKGDTCQAFQEQPKIVDVIV
jgi:predicted DCC family thiol-disulfide oxidoreductase YuxK